MSKQEDRTYDLAAAMELAELWDAGKMIGGDSHEVALTLLDEVKRLRLALTVVTEDAIKMVEASGSWDE